MPVRGWVCSRSFRWNRAENLEWETGWKWDPSFMLQKMESWGDQFRKAMHHNGELSNAHSVMETVKDWQTNQAVTRYQIRKLQNIKS
jgi:hypothetical protein